MNTAVTNPLWPRSWSTVGGVMAQPSAGGVYPPASSFRAPTGRLSGGAIAAILVGALLFFPGAFGLKSGLNLGLNGLFGKKERTPKKLKPGIKVNNRNWQPPANHAGYKPSYAASVPQSQRKLFYKGAKGQWYSNYALALQKAMGRTKSLQDALDWVNTKGYYDQNIKDNVNDPNTEVGFKDVIRGVQSSQKTTIFNKADNGNPNKPRFFLFIGSDTKSGQMKELVHTMANEYDLDPKHVVFTKGSTKADIEAGYAKIRGMVDASTNPDHAEVLTWVMPDHAGRQGSIDESKPQGAHTVAFHDGDVNDTSQAVTDTELHAIEQKYLAKKNVASVNDYCRGGAAIHSTASG